MSAITRTDAAAPTHILGAIEIIRLHHRLSNLVDVFVEAGITSATGYRRIKKPGDITLAEMDSIALRWNVPTHVMAEGDIATFTWLKGRVTPDDPDGQDLTPRAWNGDNVVDLGARRNAAPLLQEIAA